MTNQQFKNCLYQLVKSDYGFELYNHNENIICFSFYHLNSLYNAFCTAVFSNNKWCVPYVDWQYATENKRIANYTKKIVAFMIEYHKNHGNIEWCINEIEYYSKLANNVFHAKYDTEIVLHTMN